MLSVGDACWVPEPNAAGFVRGKILTAADGSMLVQEDATGKQHEVAAGDAHPVNPDNQAGCRDNTELMYLREPHMLHNLKQRYCKDAVYTYTAHILIACNPFKKLPIYDEKRMVEYSGKSLGVMEPHVFAIADRAYRSMAHYGQSQAVIISGESGSGKTETAKIVMSFLAWAGGGHGKSGSKRTSNHEQPASSALASRVLQANPLLESFGNARTLRNDNSSRFGKFTKILFSADGAIAGAQVATYLLEKSRVITHAPGERGYHAFYELCAGASKQQRFALRLPANGETAAREFAYLVAQEAQPEVHERETDLKQDTAQFQDLVSSCDACGISKEVIDQVLQLLSGLLHLGSMRFVEKADGDGCTLAGEAAAASRSAAAELLGLKIDELDKITTTRTLSSGRKSLYSVPLSTTQAGQSRDAISKMVYSRLFGTLVERINQSLADEEGECANVATFIGILDIYGFETFQVNSFEQLCINFANEKLQQHFIVHTFEQEQELYRMEGIQWKQIQYSDNRDCLDLLQDKKSGLFALLDDICRMPKPSDAAFLQRVYDEQLGKCKRLQQPKPGRSAGFTHSAREAFVVEHFAGKVCYAISGFVDKNTDALTVDCELALSQSSQPLVNAAFSAQPDAAKGSKHPHSKAASTFGLGGGGGGGTARGKKATVSSAYMLQMAHLHEDLIACSPNFIRCIKTNRASRPNSFDGAYVLMQLRCSGMMEALELMQAGFPTRAPYKELASRYRPVMPASVARLADSTFVEAILEALEMKRDKFKLGITRVFFRAGQLAFLERLTGQGDLSPAEIADRVSTWLKKRRMRLFRLAMLTYLILERLRRVLKLARFLKYSSRILVPLRRWQCRAQNRLLGNAAIAIQAGFRQCIAIRLKGRKLHGTRKVQALMRGALARKANAKRLAVQRRREEVASREKALHAKRRASRASLGGGSMRHQMALARAAHESTHHLGSQDQGPAHSQGQRQSLDSNNSDTNVQPSNEANSTLQTLLELARQQAIQFTMMNARFDALEARLEQGSEEFVYEDDRSNTVSGRDRPSNDEGLDSNGDKTTRARKTDAQFSASASDRRLIALEALMQRVVQQGAAATGGHGSLHDQELQDENEELKQEMIELKMDAAEHEMEVQELQHRANTAEAALAKAREELRSAHEDLESLVGQKSQLQLENIGLEEAVAEARQEKDTALEEIDELKLRLEQQEEEIDVISRSAQDMAQLQAAKSVAERTTFAMSAAPNQSRLNTPPANSTRSSFLPSGGSSRELRSESNDELNIVRTQTFSGGRARAETSAGRMMPWSIMDKQRSRGSSFSSDSQADSSPGGRSTGSVATTPASSSGGTPTPSGGRKRQDSRSWFGR